MTDEPEEKKGGRSYRRRRRDSSEEEESKSDDDQTLQQIEETRALRELKKRKHGIDITAIMPSSSDVRPSERVSTDDPLRLKSGGGLANMAVLRQMSADVAAATTSSIGTAFAAETKRRDEDLELLRYVEEEMNRRRGTAGERGKSNAPVRSSNPKAMLYELPDYLKVESGQKKKEENLSSQMLTGIPEVDLGIEAKMKNIEETEAAKQKLWEEMRGNKDEASDFVPTNYAVNFVQHNRWSSSTSRVAPNVQAAFVQAAARRANEVAAREAEAAAQAAKVVVQISEPGSEGVGYIPPRPVEEPKQRFGKHQHHKKHHKKHKNP